MEMYKNTKFTLPIVVYLDANILLYTKQLIQICIRNIYTVTYDMELKTAQHIKKTIVKNLPLYDFAHKFS